MQICAYLVFAYFYLFCKTFGPWCKTLQVLHDSNAFDPAICTKTGMELFLQFFFSLIFMIREQQDWSTDL